MLVLDSCSTETVSIENYEIHISRFVFTYIQVYLYRVFFLTTLDIYKNYFKGRQRWCKVMQPNANWLCMQIVTGDRICPSSSYSSVEVSVSLRQGFCNQGASWSLSFGWTEELCSQHLPQVGVLVMHFDPFINWLVTYLKPCIERRDCYYIISPTGYWGKGSIVGWY